MLAYIAIDHIRHNGVDYDLGDDLEMSDFTEKELAALQAAGVIDEVPGDADDKTDTDITPRYAVAETGVLNYNGVDYAPVSALDAVEIAEADLAQMLADGVIVAVAADNPAAEADKVVSEKSKKKPAASI